MSSIDEIPAIVHGLVAALAPRSGRVDRRRELVGDLGYESVSLINLMSAIEDRLGLVPISGDRIIEVVTVGDLERLVRELMVEKGCDADECG
ncbi:acyl carrier protein [Nocardia sp. Marseille-Q1738]